MSNYNETIIPGDITKWQRARQIVLDNPHGGNPRATCHETEITVLPDGQAIEKALGNLAHEMIDPSVEIPLVYPNTFEPTETTFTAGQFYLMAASVYLWLARQRDGET